MYMIAVGDNVNASGAGADGERAGEWDEATGPVNVGVHLEFT